MVDSCMANTGDLAFADDRRLRASDLARPLARVAATTGWRRRRIGNIDKEVGGKHVMLEYILHFTAVTNALAKQP